jgi:hypothetical protein
MIPLDAQQRMQAVHIHHLLVSQMDIGPAKREPTKAPTVMSDEMSCWTFGVKFHPIGEFGSWKPKTLTSLVANCGRLRGTYPQEADHSLEASNKTKVNAILKGREREEETCQQALPVMLRGVVVACHGVEGTEYRCRRWEKQTCSDVGGFYEFCMLAKLAVHMEQTIFNAGWC